MADETTGTEFLRERFPGLHNDPHVKRAVKRAEELTDSDSDSKDPDVRIQIYLDRFREIIEGDNPELRQRQMQMLKHILVDKYVIKIENIPENYWQSQMRVLSKRGESGDWQRLPEKRQLEIKKEHFTQVKEDQQGSLEEWIDYLASERSPYLPDYLKYWVFQGMLKLERYKKGEKEETDRFPERPSGKQRSVKMFPEVNERGLKFIAHAFDALSNKKTIHFRYDIGLSAREEFLELLQKKDFRSLYGWSQEYIPQISEAEMQTTDGNWRTYQHGEADSLVATLQGKGSGWCIAGREIANHYLSYGKIHVYYTLDREGKLTISSQLFHISVGLVEHVSSWKIF